MQLYLGVWLCFRRCGHPPWCSTRFHRGMRYLSQLMACSVCVCSNSPHTPIFSAYLSPFFYSSFPSSLHAVQQAAVHIIRKSKKNVRYLRVCVCVRTVCAGESTWVIHLCRVGLRLCVFVFFSSSPFLFVCFICYSSFRKENNPTSVSLVSLSLSYLPQC